MTKALQWKDTIRPLQMATSAEFLCLTMGLTPKKLQLQNLYFMASVTPVNGLDVTIPNESLPSVPAAMLVHFLSFLLCLVSSSPFCHKSYICTVIHTSIHTFIHACMQQI